MEEEKNGLGREEIGEGGGAVAFKKILLPRGLQFSTVIILGAGESFDTPHFS